jgi:hypothetical protein
VPDLLDDLRRYGDAVETAALDRDRPAYVADDEHAELRQRRRRPSRRVVLIGVAASLLVVLFVSLVVLRDDGSDSVRIETPPTTNAPTTSSLPPPAAPPADSTELPQSDVSWIPIEAAPLSPRLGASTVWTGSDMIVWGGVDAAAQGGGSTREDGAIYRINQRSWTLLPPAPISARPAAVSVWTGQEMLVWGVDGNSGLASQLDGAAYDPGSATWRTIAVSPLPSGVSYSGAWTGSELVVIGITPTETVAASYDPVRDSWRPLDPPPFALASSTSRSAAVWTGSHVVTVELVPLDGPLEVLVYDPEADGWETTAPDYSFRSLAVAALDGRAHLVSYSGIEGTVALDPTSGTWDQRVVIPPLGCEAGPTVTAMSSTLLIQDGCGRTGIYDPSARTFQPIHNPLEGAAVTYGQLTSVVWTGERLVGLGFTVSGSTSQSKAWIFTP